MSSHAPTSHSSLKEAQGLIQKGEPAAAQRLLDGYLSQNPDEVRARYLWGLARLEQDDASVAERTFRTILGENPENYPAAFSLGLALEQQEQTEEALDAFETALSLKPDFGPARAKLAAHGRSASRVESGTRHGAPRERGATAASGASGARKGKTGARHRAEDRETAVRQGKQKEAIPPGTGLAGFLNELQRPAAKRAVQLIEELSLERRPNKSVWLPELLLYVLVVALGVVMIRGLGWVQAGGGLAPGVVPAVSGIVLIGMLLRVYQCLRLATTRYIFGDGRMQVEKGIFSRTIRSLELYRIVDVRMRQGPWLLAVGDATLILEGPNEGRFKLVGLGSRQEVASLFEKLRELVALLRTLPEFRQLESASGLGSRSGASPF